MAKRPRAQEAPADWKPTQAVPEPILNSAVRRADTALALQGWRPRGGRDPGGRPATSTRPKRSAPRQQDLLAEEERDDLELVNRLREDVKRWREAGYRGASPSRAICWRTGRVTDRDTAALLLPGRSRRDPHLPARARHPRPSRRDWLTRHSRWTPRCCPRLLAGDSPTFRRQRTILYPRADRSIRQA